MWLEKEPLQLLHEQLREGASIDSESTAGGYPVSCNVQAGFELLLVAHCGVGPNLFAQRSASSWKWVNGSAVRVIVCAVSTAGSCLP